MSMGPGVDARIRLLADQAEIADVIYRFQEGVDGKDPDLILTCLAPETELDLEDGFVVRGIEHANDYFRNFVGVKQVDLDDIDASTHVMANLRITVEGDTASAHFVGVSHLFGKRSGQPTALIRGLGYDDTYARLEDGWKMTSRAKRLKWMYETVPTFVAVTAVSTEQARLT